MKHKIALVMKQGTKRFIIGGSDFYNARVRGVDFGCDNPSNIRYANEKELTKAK